MQKSTALFPGKVRYNEEIGLRELLFWLPSAESHQFAVTALAGDVDPGRPQRGQLQHKLLQLNIRIIDWPETIDRLLLRFRKSMTLAPGQ